MNPEKITTKDIKKEKNQEVRRVMIERYKTGQSIHGYGAYLLDAGGTKVHEDETGILWRMKNEDITLVEVLNGTVEQDGSRNRYFLSVPPQTKEAIEGVAWTYGMSPHEYKRLVIRT